MIGSYALILLAGVFLLLLALLCGMSVGNSCGDEGFESLLSWMSVGSVGIKLGLAVFLISAAGKLVIEYQLDANGMPVKNKTRNDGQHHGEVALSSLRSEVAIPNRAPRRSAVPEMRSRVYGGHGVRAIQKVVCSHVLTSSGSNSPAFPR